MLQNLESDRLGNDSQKGKEMTNLRKIAAKRLTVACIAAVASSASAAAWANSYAEVKNATVPAGDADKGASVTIKTDDLIATCAKFVNHEMWYGVVSNGSFWVEVGFTSGFVQGGGCTSPTIFWADNRNGGGYHEHYPGNSWSFGTWYQLWIGQGSNTCAWTVNIGSLQLGTSTNNCPGTGRFLSAGIETQSTQSMYLAKGFLSTFLRDDSGGTWRSGWDGPVLFQNNPPRIQWTDPGNSGTEEVLNAAF